MKDEKKIRDKYKQLKYQHLKKIYEKNLSKMPENCKYNKKIILPNKYRVNICGFDIDNATDVDLCYKQEHSKDCNAFCPQKSKDQLKEQFQNEIEDTQIRATKFKDLSTLFWLLPSVEEDLPKKGWFAKILAFLFS